MNCDTNSMQSCSPAVRQRRAICRFPGANLDGIHFAMEYLPLQNKRCEGDDIPDSEFITAKDKNVVIIGGGDTGADCLGTVHRQGARSVVQFELLPKPPTERAADNPWPNWPNIFRTSSAHEEGGDREYCVLTKSFTGEREGRKLQAVRVEFVDRSCVKFPEPNSNSMRSRAARDGIPRARTQRHAGATRRQYQRTRQRRHRCRTR